MAAHAQPAILTHDQPAPLAVPPSTRFAPLWQTIQERELLEQEEEQRAEQEKQRLEERKVRQPAGRHPPAAVGSFSLAWACCHGPLLPGVAEAASAASALQDGGSGDRVVSSAEQPL